MNFKRMKKLILILGFLLSPQASFAMKRSNPYANPSSVGWHTLDQISILATVFAKALQVLLDKPAPPMDVDVPSDAQTHGVTFVSETGQEFFFPHHQFAQLSQLAPTLGEMISDIQEDADSWGIPIPLDHVSSHTLVLLTYLLEDEFDGLRDYFFSLTEEELEKIKNDAQFLDSKALQTLITRFLQYHFNSDLSIEILTMILSRCGPLGRNRMREVSTFFKDLVDRIREPKEENGFGLTDTLPITAEIPTTGHFAQAPVFLKNHLYAISSEGILYVIDLATLQIIKKIKVGRSVHSPSPLAPIIVGQYLYVISDDERTLTVIDTKIHEVTETIKLPHRPGASILFGQYLYIVNPYHQSVSVIDITTHKIIKIIQGVGSHPIALVAFGQYIYVANEGGGTLSVIDTTTFEVIENIKTGEWQRAPVRVGQYLYVANKFDDTISVIDATTHEVISTIEVGKSPGRPVVSGQYLFVANCDDNTVSVIDTTMHKVISTIEVGKRPRTSTVVEQYLFVANFDDHTVSVIDTTMHKVISTIKLGEKGCPRQMGAFKQYLCILCDGKIVIVDIGGYIIQ